MSYHLLRLIKKKYESLLAEGVEMGPDYLDCEVFAPHSFVCMFPKGAITYSLETGLHEVHGPIYQAWKELGGERVLGLPVSDQMPCSDGVGFFSRFRKFNSEEHTDSIIIWHPHIGAFIIRDVIFQKWLSYSQTDSLFGYPIMNQTQVPGDRNKWYQIFRQFNLNSTNKISDGAIFSWGSHAFALPEVFFTKWKLLGFTQKCYPLSDEVMSVDGHGLSIHFLEVETNALSSIYFHPSCGAFYLRSNIRDKWYQSGAETGIFGYPVSDEIECVDGLHRYSLFCPASHPNFAKSSSGVIVEGPDKKVSALYGPIYEKWLECGAEQRLGFPITDILNCPDGVGKFAHFRHPTSVESSIYYTLSTGAYFLSNAIRSRWAELGWESGQLGYPISDEELLASGTRVTRFQNGIIECDSNMNAWVIHRN